MTNHPSFHTFTGAMGFLQGLENDRKAEIQRKRDIAARQQELNDVYNEGVSDYNKLVNEYNNLNTEYKLTLKNEDKYRNIALELAKYLQDKQGEKHELNCQIEGLEHQLQQAKQQLNSALNDLETVKNRNLASFNEIKSLNQTVAQDKKKISELLVSNSHLEKTIENQKLSIECQDLKINQIKSGFQKISTQSNSEQMVIKYVFTKFKVLKNIVDHLVINGQLDKINLSKIEETLIDKWDVEDISNGSVTSSEAGAFVAIENPELYQKLKVFR